MFSFFINVEVNTFPIFFTPQKKFWVYLAVTLTRDMIKHSKLLKSNKLYRNNHSLGNVLVSERFGVRHHTPIKWQHTSFNKLSWRI